MNALKVQKKRPAVEEMVVKLPEEMLTAIVNDHFARNGGKPMPNGVVPWLLSIDPDTGKESKTVLGERLVVYLWRDLPSGQQEPIVGNKKTEKPQAASV